MVIFHVSAYRNAKYYKIVHHYFFSYFGYFLVILVISERTSAYVHNAIVVT